MKMQVTSLAYVVLILPFSLMQSGCSNVLAFGTATKFGLDISQQADKTINVSLGYDRAEIASIPVPKKSDGSACLAENKSGTTCNTDAYSVLGSFSINYGNPWTLKPFELNQFFATGMAARKAANNSVISGFFGKKSGEIANKTSGTKQ